jgi:hypothetical protein
MANTHSNDENSAESSAKRQSEILSRLLIPPRYDDGPLVAVEDLSQVQRDLQAVLDLSNDERNRFLALANDHHVIVRALTVLEHIARRVGANEIVEWCVEPLLAERARIERALTFLDRICRVLESKGCRVTVIKSLDHMPDLGSDLDLCSDADHHEIEKLMREEFRATQFERSLGDRLASKWNYRVPGLSELVEIHVQHLGQTGEHTELVDRVIRRRLSKTVGGIDFFVPAPEERIVVSTLQRVYRHFFYRLCDMVETAALVQGGDVDFIELQRAAQAIGVWPGVATYLCLVRNYVRHFGSDLNLPEQVTLSAYDSESNVEFSRGYLRVPMTTAAALYARQLKEAVMKRDARAVLRLPLLPPLAVSALIAQQFTGSDKGIW